MPKADGRQALVDKATRRELRRLREDFPEEDIRESDVRASVSRRANEDLLRLVNEVHLKRGASPSTGIIWTAEQQVLRAIDSLVVEEKKSVRNACAIVAKRLERAGWRPEKFYDDRPRLKKATPEALRSLYRKFQRKKACRQN